MFITGNPIDLLLDERDAQKLTILAQLRQVAVVGAPSVAQAVALSVKCDGGHNDQIDFRWGYNREARVVLGGERCP